MTRAEALLEEALALPDDERAEIAGALLESLETGSRVILEPVRRTWSPEFLALADSALDFLYPEELPFSEPGPNSLR
jgi:hypothetical protein